MKVNSVMPLFNMWLTIQIQRTLRVPFAAAMAVRADVQLVLDFEEAASIGHEAQNRYPCVMTDRCGTSVNLETDRLLLRPWTSKDVEALVQGLGDLQVSSWLARVPHPYTELDAERWVAYCSRLHPLRDGGNECQWVIELRAERRAIGGVSLERFDRLNGTAGGGIWLNSGYLGRGYGSEAFGEKVRFAFDDLGLRRLENGFFAGNEASWRMQERLGFRIEGTKRQGLRCMADGRLKDEVITGLLREDWEARRQRGS